MKSLKSKTPKFKLGDRVHGYRFIRNVHDKYDPVKYIGTIIHNFNDDSYLVQDEKGDELLIELYFNETMNFIKDKANVIPSTIRLFKRK